MEFHLNCINQSIMKKIITLLIFIVTSSVYAQNSGITYQAVIYNPSTEILPGNNNPNVVLAEKNICLRFSISDANSSVEYQEVQKVKTDEFGMVNLIVGEGDQVSGYAANFDAIIWNSSNKNLKVEIDTNGNCTNFIEISNQKFASVPFAFASKVAETVSGIVPIVNGGTGADTVAGAKTNLGLNNVDNTSDLNKPVSTATQTALNGKEDKSNKSTATALGTSDVLYPTQNAVKVYVDSQVANATPDATTTVKGKLQLAGDLGGTADAPTVPGLANKENAANKSTDTSLGNSDILFPTQKAVKTYVDNLVSSGVADATTSDKGKIQLAGDLSGTADAPTVPGLLSKEPTITAGTISQYFRGDKTWQTLDKTTVGLDNVDNTSDSNKPVSSAVQTALNAKEDASNKSTDTLLGTSNLMFPTQNAVKTYVDNQIATSSTPEATSSVKGKIQLGGDLAGTGTTASAPKISAGAISAEKLADNAVTNAKLGEIVAIAKGGTGSNMNTTAGYVKQATTGANFSTVSTIPVADVDGAVRKVNGVTPDANGNVAVIIGRVFTGTTFNPNSAASVIAINSGPNPIKESDIYIVSGQSGTPNDNGRTFINDGTNWLEISTNVAALESTFVKLSGSTMAGNLDFPTGKKIIIADAPTGSTDAVNKAYVDGLVTSSATPDATDLIKGKIKLAGDLGGTADLPTVPDLALKAPIESPSLTGTPLAPTAAAGTNTTQIATTAFVTTATAGKQDAITLTTSGTGAASLVGSTLNIPTPNNGTVTEVSALTIGTSGTDITSTIATATTTPVVTLNVPTASAANRGALSATDWTTFNDKIGGSGTTNFIPKFSAAKTLTDSSIFDDGTKVGIGTSSPANTLEINQGTAGNSGLRFTNLNSSSVATTASNKVLGLNSTGDVILTNVPGTQNIVDFSTATPTTSGVVFTPNTPADQSVIYQSAANNSLWTYNGSTYVTYSPPATTAWNLAGTTNDAGGNKLSAIERTGSASVTNGFLRASGNSNSFTMDPTQGGGPRLMLGTTVAPSSYFELGAYNGVNNFDTKARDFNVFSTARANALVLKHNTGNIGIGTNTPTATLDVNSITAASNTVNTDVTMLKLARPLNSGLKFPNIAQFNLGSFSTGGQSNTRLDLNLSNTNDTDIANVMTWQANGNVGIGTTSPGYKLSVIGNTRIQPNTTNTGSGGDALWVEIYGKAPPAIDTQAGGIKLGWYNTFGGIEVVRPGSASGVGLAFNYATVGGTTTEGFRLTNAGRVGIGTTAPTSTLEVNGSATNTAAFNNGGSATAIAFSMSNLAYTTLSPQLFALTGIKDGGTYTLAVQGPTQGTSTFIAPGFTFRYVNNGPSIANTHTLYTFVVMGTTVYVYTTIGFTP